MGENNYEFDTQKENLVIEMRDLNQSIIQFDYEQKFTEDDFYISKSNEHIFLFLNRWPKWNNKFLNIVGENFREKTHLINIFIKKYKAFKINSRYLRNEDFLKLKLSKILFWKT